MMKKSNSFHTQNVWIIKSLKTLFNLNGIFFRNHFLHAEENRHLLNLL